MASPRRRIASGSSLRQWALDEMHFHSTSYLDRNQLPSEEDFDKLCRPPLIDMWLYLIDHIRAKEFVKQVKDNIKLLDVNQKDDEFPGLLKNDNPQHRLRRRKQELEAKIASCQAEVATIEREAIQASQVLEETSRIYEKAVLQVHNLQRKKCLLTVVERRAQEKSAEYQEYAERLDSHADEITKKSKEDEWDNYVPTPAHDSTSDTETESCRDVRMVCDAIGKYLHSTIEDSDTSQTGVLDKNDLVLSVEQLHGSHSVQALCRAMTEHTTTCSRRLREDTVRINIESDAHDLSFSIDRKGHLHDRSDPPSVQTSVRKLLQTSNLNHVMRWFEEQKFLNESWKIEAQLDNMKADIHKMIVKSMGANPDLVRQAESYADCLLRLASERAVLPCLKQEVENLVSRINTAREEREELRQKFACIEEFKEVVEKKQNILGRLVRHNSTAPTRLAKQKDQCKQYVQARPVQTHLQSVDRMTSDLRGSLQTELGRVHPLPLLCFLSVPSKSGLRSSVLDSRIAASVLPGALHLLPARTVLCDTLRFPSYKTNNAMLQHVMELQDGVLEAQLSQARIAADRKSMCRRAGASDDARKHLDLQRLSQEKDASLEAAVTPRLEQMRDMALKWQDRVSKSVPLAVEDWWQQPAQFTTPWLSVESMTFDQWMKRFKIIVAHIHKKQMEKQKSVDK